MIIFALAVFCQVLLFATRVVQLTAHSITALVIIVVANFNWHP